MRLCSEKKLIQLLGPVTNNKFFFVTLNKLYLMYKLSFGLVHWETSDICLIYLNVRGMLMSVSFCVYLGKVLSLCDFI